MARDIQLDGGEISVIKALGTGGGEVTGEVLLTRISSMSVHEMADVLKSLIMMGYVDADKRSFHGEEEFKATNFHVNSGYARDLREALDPQPEQRSRRVRRE